MIYFIFVRKRILTVAQKNFDYQKKFQKKKRVINQRIFQQFQICDFIKLNCA
jgi:hypothetical protein